MAVVWTVFTEAIKVKCGHWAWSPSNPSGISIKKEGIRTQMYTEGDHVRTQGEAKEGGLRRNQPGQHPNFELLVPGW